MRISDFTVSEVNRFLDLCNFTEDEEKVFKLLARGYYQEEGKEAVEMKPGDCINIPVGVKHWHGAAKDSISIQLQTCVYEIYNKHVCKNGILTPIDNLGHMCLWFSI